MEISDIPLSPQQKEFLKSENTLHFNKSAYRKVISLKLDKSVKTIKAILDDTHNLSEDRIYEILNARTLSKILTNLLLDVEKPTEERRNRYDFRTIETARLLFEVSANYLRKSRFFEDNEAIKSDINRVSNHFVSLAEIGLDKETNNKLDYELEKELTIQGVFYATKLYEASTKPGNEAYEILQKIKKLTELNKSMMEEIKTIENKEKKADAEKRHYIILLELDDLLKKHKLLVEPLHEKNKEIINTLNKKYSNVYDYSCPVNPLVEFSELKEMENLGDM